MMAPALEASMEHLEAKHRRQPRLAGAIATARRQARGCRSSNRRGRSASCRRVASPAHPSIPRRFLTAEDVRRARGPEIVIEDGTVVTPQALEAAHSSGITIRTGNGSYREPEPDRGPDAERAQRSLPHLPEPVDDTLGTSVVVTAVGKNRRGVLAEITAALNSSGASVQNVSQRVLEGFFHIILVVELDPGASFEQLKTCLECLGGPEDYVVRVMHGHVFRFMHRI